MGVVEVETARLPDREAVLALLQERGVTAEPREDLSIDVRGERDEVLAELEALVREAELPLVPVEADGRIFLRPPGD